MTLSALRGAGAAAALNPSAERTKLARAMPPPSFSVPSTSGINVPRGTLNLIREVENQADALLAKGARGAAVTLPSVRALLADPALDLQYSTDTIHHYDAYVKPPSSTCRAVAERVNLDLLESYTNVPQRTSALYDTMLPLFEELLPLLLASPAVVQWWDALLVPALSLESLSEPNVARAQRLCASLLMAPVSMDEQLSKLDAQSGLSADTTLPPELQVVQNALSCFCKATMPSSPPSVPMQNTAPLPPAAQPLATRLESVLAMYSEQRPSSFLLHVALLYRRPEYQHALLDLLLVFLHRSSMHTYRITSTSLALAIPASLCHVTYTPTMTLGVQCLIMILPHVPQWLIRNGGGGLASMFRVYARVVCWPLSLKEGEREPDAQLLFTVLYGLFPWHFLRFLRAPDETLHAMGVAEGIDELDGATMRTRSMMLLQRHFVHPNFVLMDAEAELAAKGWQQYDASDRMALSLSLYQPPHPGGSSGARPPEPGIDAAAHAAACSAPTDAERLRDELRFEQFMKEQLLLHIGRLHRDRITEAASEAEHQNLQQANRTLQTQLTALQARHERQRAEMQATSHRHVMWEKELNAKLNSYRERRRQSLEHQRRLEQELQDLQTRLRTQVEQTSAMATRLFELEADLKLAAPKMARLEEYGTSVRRMNECLYEWESSLQRVDEQRSEMENMLMRWESSQLAMQNSERHALQLSREVGDAQRRNERLATQVEALQLQNERLRDQIGEGLTRLMGPSRAAQPRSASPRLHAAHARIEALELQAMDLRAELEQLRLDKALCERTLAAQPRSSNDAASPSAAAQAGATGAAAPSPPTHDATPAPPPAESDVPPLALGSPERQCTPPPPPRSQAPAASRDTMASPAWARRP